MERLSRGERLINFETVRVAKNGSRLNVLLTVSPIRDSRKRIIGASSIARDITAQKLAEQALQKSEKLALAGRMAATIAHEINNPLEAVNNILYLLQNSVELSPEGRKFVELASHELERVMQITQLTLGMQRGPSRHPVTLQVTQLIENVLTLYLGKSRKLGIKTCRRYSDEGTLVGFPVELQQVFANLILNAMDAMATDVAKASGGAQGLISRLERRARRRSALAPRWSELTAAAMVSGRSRSAVSGCFAGAQKSWPAEILRELQSMPMTIFGKRY
jgi:signal transduction histidine kinase